MADILIRGMEEPPRCSACRMLEGDTDDGFCHAADKWFDDEYFSWYQYPEGDIATDKPLNCPLISLPEGHGRLIDADALLNNNGVGTQIAGWGKMFHETAISYALTIVPAEGGTDDDGNA